MLRAIASIIIASCMSANAASIVTPQEMFDQPEAQATHYTVSLDAARTRTELELTRPDPMPDPFAQALEAQPRLLTIPEPQYGWLVFGTICFWAIMVKLWKAASDSQATET